MVTMKRQTAITIMDTNRQSLFSDDSAAGASLTRVSRIDFNESPIGTLSLIAKHIEERGPRSIVNLFRKKAARHPFNVQLLDHDQIVLANQICREIVLKVLSFIKNLLVNRTELGDSFSPTVRSFLSSGDSTLSNTELLRGRFVILPVVDMRTVREGGEGFDTNVDTDRFTCRRKCVIGDLITRDNGKPLPAFTLGGDLFYLAFNRHRQFNFQVTDKRQIQPAVSEAKAFFVVNDRIKERLSFESGVSGFCTTLNTTEKVSERSVKLSKRFLQDSCINLLVVGIKRISDLGNLFDLVEARNLYTAYSPSIPPFGKCRVIKLSQQFQRCFEAFALSLVRVNSELISTPRHGLIISN